MCHEAATVSDAQIRERLTIGFRDSRLLIAARDSIWLYNLRDKIPAAVGQVPQDLVAFTPQEFLQVLWFVDNNPGFDVPMGSEAKRFLITLVAAVCKRGTISNAKLRNSVRQSARELGYEDLQIQRSELDRFWTNYLSKLDFDHPTIQGPQQVNIGVPQPIIGYVPGQPYVPPPAPAPNPAVPAPAAPVAQNAPVIQHAGNPTWDSFFTALRAQCTASITLRNLVDQSRYGGMTSAHLTFRAYKRFRNFDWTLAFSRYPQEYANILNAWNHLDIDPYCGFRDPNPAPQTGYLTLGYLGIQLLIEVNGETTLREYDGISKSHNIPEKALVDRWVDFYRTQVTAAQPMINPYSTQPHNAHMNFTFA